MVESNELSKNDFDIDRDSTALEGQKKKKKINKLAEERSSGFRNKSNIDNLICKYKTEGRSPKDLRFIKIQ